MHEVFVAFDTPRTRRFGLQTVMLVIMAMATGCAVLGYSDRVLWRVASPSGDLFAVCQEVPVFDGPGYVVRLERPDGTVVRRLYQVGDGDPCTEVRWSPDGRTLGVLSGPVARLRFVDVAWALAHADIRTEYWSWRQVDLADEHIRAVGRGLQFVGPTAVQLDVCPGGPTTELGRCRSEVRRFDIPLPIVTGHREGPA